VSTTESPPLEITKLLVAAAPQQMAAAIEFAVNTNQPPTALGPQQEVPHMEAIFAGRWWWWRRQQRQQFLPRRRKKSWWWR
jgi:hypothetical protein